MRRGNGQEGGAVTHTHLRTPHIRPPTAEDISSARRMYLLGFLFLPFVWLVGAVSCGVMGCDDMFVYVYAFAFLRACVRICVILW